MAIGNSEMMNFILMGKSAKLVKRPTKKQKEQRELTRSVTAALTKEPLKQVVDGGVVKKKKTGETGNRKRDYVELMYGKKNT
jgi:hypothetical protein